MRMGRRLLIGLEAENLILISWGASLAYTLASRFMGDGWKGRVILLIIVKANDYDEDGNVNVDECLLDAEGQITLILRHLLWL